MRNFLIILAVSAVLQTSHADMTDVETKFIENEILADLKLDAAPKNLVEINYPTGATVNLGNELSPTQVKDIPFLQWENEKDALYTVFMVDPDAPSRKESTYREVRHWLVGEYLFIAEDSLIHIFRTSSFVLYLTAIVNLYKIKGLLSILLQ